MVAQVKNLGSRQKFLFIVSCEDPNVIKKFAIFIAQLNKERELAITL